MMIRGWARRAAVLLAAAVVVGTALLAGTAAPAAADAPGQWWADELDLEALHQVTRGEGATIGIVDTGVDVTHPDLVGADISGKDSWSPGKDGLTDAQGHGTGMASLLVGQGKDGGVLGVAPDARLLMYAAETGLGDSYYQPDVVAGIWWLVEQQVDVIVLAMGSPSTPHQAEFSALRAAERVGIPVVAAAGNTETSIHPEVEWPAATPGVLAVSGTKRGGVFSKASMFGPEVAIAAPAEDIGAALPHDLPGFGGDLYFTSSGTSVSSGLVGGVIALLAARYPDATREQLLHRLTSTATDQGPEGRDEQYGYGVVDALAALDEGVDMTGAAPAPAARAALPAWSATPMPGFAMPKGPVRTRADIWIACGLAIVGGMVLVMVAFRGPRRLRPAALNLAVLLVATAATGTAVTIDRVTNPPDTAVMWPEFTSPPPQADQPYMNVCKQVSNEAGLFLGLFLEPGSPYREDDEPEVCEIEFTDSGYADDPQPAARNLAVRITWQPLTLDGEPASPLLGCPEGASIWTAANIPVCTQETPDPDFDTYSTSRFVIRQAWVTVEVLEETRLDRPDFVHELLTLAVPLIAAGSRAA